MSAEGRELARQISALRRLLIGFAALVAIAIGLLAWRVDALAATPTSSRAVTTAGERVPPHPRHPARGDLLVRVSPRPVSRGTPRPALPKPAPTATPESHGDLFPEPWQSLAECESIGDLSWRPESSSTYRGYFQFLPSTWESVGGTGDPALASAAEQLHRARLLQARDGWSPWPVCSRKVGLR